MNKSTSKSMTAKLTENEYLKSLIPFINHVLNQHPNLWPDGDYDIAYSMASTSTLGLIRSGKITKGHEDELKFISNRICWDLKDHIRSKTGSRNMRDIRPTFISMGGIASQLIVDTHEPELSEEQVEEFVRDLKYFPKQDPRFIEIAKYLILGYNQAEIGKLMGYTKSRISQLVCQMRKIINERLAVVA